VVIAIIAILAAILFPIFVSAKESGKKARCAAQIKQLSQAIILYTDDNNGYYVPAASDMDGSGGGLKRWHGTRTNTSGSFNPKRGPLWAYLGRSGGLKVCPGNPLLQDKTTSPNAFESGCGGYGYNAQYVGGTAYKNSFPRSNREASSTTDIQNPGRTIMLADSAMALSSPQPHLIEYSFVEPPYIPIPGSNTSGNASSPSIHFRHNGTANVAWCDGHVTAEKMAFTTSRNVYGASNEPVHIGWFGPKDNSLFDNR
jgi:prepilin-type processing-associated H-X9-DG protein